MCIAKLPGEELEEKIRYSAGKMFWMRCPNKKGAGRENSSPRYTPVSRLSDGFAVIQLEMVASVKLSRQNLTALCTTASQNLAAVCGSHSLTETVDLGAMTLGGLVGTLHVVNNSFQNHLCSASH